MGLRIVLGSIFLTFFVTACGGGDDGAAKDQSNIVLSQSDQLAGQLTKDIDTLPKDRSVGQLALSGSEVENSVCFANLPSYRNLNDLYFNRSLVLPTEDLYFEYTIGENEFSSSTSELMFMAQNKSVYQILESLLFSVKKNPGDGKPPQFEISKSKPIYHDIRGFCRDIQCAADSVFGDSWGLRFLFKDRFGVLLSGYVDPKTEPYANNDQLDSVAKAILSLPKGTFPLSKSNFLPNRDGHEIEKSVVFAPYLTGLAPPDSSLASSAAITLSGRGGLSAEDSKVSFVDVYFFEPWKQQRDHYTKVSTVFHELIHVLDQSKEQGHVLSQTKEWLNISKWSKDSRDGSWKLGREKLKCSVYGSTSPAEDFAECGSLYRFAPLRLKKISKSKYNFFKKRVFNNVEYTNVSRCKNEVEIF